MAAINALALSLARDVNANWYVYRCAISDKSQGVAASASERLRPRGRVCALGVAPGGNKSLSQFGNK